MTLHLLGDNAREAGNWPVAIAAYQESLAHHWTQRDPLGVADALLRLAQILVALGDMELATRFFGSAEAQRELTGTMVYEPARLRSTSRPSPRRAIPSAIHRSRRRGTQAARCPWRRRSRWRPALTPRRDLPWNPHATGIVVWAESRELEVPAPRSPGAYQPGNCRRPIHQPAHRHNPPDPHPRQARPRLSHRRGSVRRPSRPGLSRPAIPCSPKLRIARPADTIGTMRIRYDVRPPLRAHDGPATAEDPGRRMPAINELSERRILMFASVRRTTLKLGPRLSVLLGRTPRSPW